MKIRCFGCASEGHFHDRLDHATGMVVERLVISTTYWWLDKKMEQQWKSVPGGEKGPEFKVLKPPVGVEIIVRSPGNFTVTNTRDAKPKRKNRK